MTLGNVNIMDLCIAYWVYDNFKRCNPLTEFWPTVAANAVILSVYLTYVVLFR